MVYSLPFPCLIAALWREERMMPITGATPQADIGAVISPRPHGYLKDIQMKVRKLPNIC